VITAARAGGFTSYAPGCATTPAQPFYVIRYLLLSGFLARLRQRRRCLAWRLMRARLSDFVRPSISQTLADDTLGRKFGALVIIHAKLHAGVIAKVELGKVAV